MARGAYCLASGGSGLFMPVSGMNMAVFLYCQWRCYVEM